MKWLKQQFRKKERVYILPTRMGGYLNGLIFLMFLLAVGYSNNLLLIFTLFLFGFNLLWVIQTHNYLQRLKLRMAEIPDGFALDSLPVTFLWEDGVAPVRKLSVSIEGTLGELSVNCFEVSGPSWKGELNLPTRGKWQWKYLRVATDFPFGLYRSWKFIQLTAASHAYPPLVKHATLPEIMKQMEGEVEVTEKSGHEGVRDLAPYQGQESRKISWKHYARSGELMIKEGEEFLSGLYEVQLSLPSDPTQKEAYLSLVATRLVLSQRQQIPFAFHSPELRVGPTSQGGHLKQCLKVLSLC